MIEIEAYPYCPGCSGAGCYGERRPWGSACATEYLSCDRCFERGLEEQLTDEELERVEAGEEVEIRARTV